MTPPSTDRSIGQLVTDALDDVRAIIDHEKALAKAEIGRAAKAGGIGAGLLAAALALIGLAVVYLLVAAAFGLVEAGMTLWGAFLLVGGVLLVPGLILAAVGAVMLKKVKGPQRTVEQGKATVEDVKEALTGDGPGPDHATRSASPAGGRSGSHSVSDAGSDHDAAVQTAKVGATTVIGTRRAGRD